MKLLKSMFHFLIIGILFTAFNSHCQIWDQLVQEEDDIIEAPPFIPGEYHAVYADDFHADIDYEFTGLSFHFSVVISPPFDGELYIEVYEDDLDGFPACSIILDEDDYTTTTTDMWYEGKQVILLESEFSPISIHFESGNIYWIAYNMEHDDAIFSIGHDPDYWDNLHENDGGGWGPYGSDIDASMRLEGFVGIESISLGQIKAAFK